MARFLNKRSQAIEDGVFMVVTIFFLAIAALTLTYMVNTIYDEFAVTPAFNESESSMAVFAAGKSINDMWDYLILAVLIGFIIANIVLGYFIDVHTVFFPIYLIGMIVIGVVCVALDYAWEKVFSNAVFASLSGTLPITNHILSNLTLYYVIIAAIGMFALFAKTRTESI